MSSSPSSPRTIPKPEPVRRALVFAPAPQFAKPGQVRRPAAYSTTTIEDSFFQRAVEELKP